MSATSVFASCRGLRSAAQRIPFTCRNIRSATSYLLLQPQQGTRQLPSRFFSSYPPHQVVGLPSLSPTMDTGSIAAWNVKAGDTFAAGDVFCSVETDKAVVDFEAQDEGVVAKLLVPAGTEVAVNSPVMILVDDVSHVSAFADYVLSDAAPAPATTAAAPVVAAAPAAPPTAPLNTAPSTAATAGSSSSSSSGKIFASPLARKLAQEMGYDISAIPGLGPAGRVVAADVKAYQPTLAAAAAAAAIVSETPSSSAPLPAGVPVPSPVGAGVGGGSYTDYPVSATAAQVAARLAQSKRNVPHYYLTVDISVDALLKLRSTLNAAVMGGTTKKINNADDASSIGVYELLIKAAALSMKTVPAANAAWMDSVVRVYDSVDINIVTGSGDSLSTPVLRDCVGKGLRAISSELQNGATGDADCGLGTLTILNVGMYGVKSCAPIIREPQACALAIGALQNRIVPNISGGGGDEAIYKESVVFTATASFDHRVVDGAVGAQWLAAFKSHVENPTTLLL